MEQFRTTAPIDYGRVETWPSDIIDLLERNRELLAQYNRQETVVVLAGSMAKYKGITNPYRAEFRGIRDELKRLLAPRLVLGRHFTRLTPRELGDLKTTGIVMSSKEYGNKRIAHALADGHLSKSTADVLRAASLYRGEDRPATISTI